MLAAHWIDQWLDKTTQVFISLGIIMVCLSGSIAYSIFMQKKGLPPEREHDES